MDALRMSNHTIQQRVFGKVSKEAKNLGLRMHTNYSDLQHFQQMKQSKDFLKVLVIGETGLGKSALCSKMVGVHLVERSCDQPESHYGMLKHVPYKESPFADPPFISHYGTRSVTKKSSFVLSHYMGDPQKKKIMLIDSPGFLDPKRSMLDHIKGKKVLIPTNHVFDDINTKLEAVGSIHAILILMSLGDGGRFTYALQKTIQAVTAMFQTHDQSVSHNLFFAFTKCDEDREDDWVDYMDDRHEEYQAIFKSLLSNNISLTPMNESRLFFLSAKNPSQFKISQSAEFQKLYQLISNTQPIITRRMQSPSQYFSQFTFSIHVYLTIFTNTHI